MARAGDRSTTFDAVLVRAERYLDLLRAVPPARLHMDRTGYDVDAEVARLGGHVRAGWALLAALGAAHDEADRQTRRAQELAEEVHVWEQALRLRLIFAERRAGPAAQPHRARVARYLRLGRPRFEGALEDLRSLLPELTLALPAFGGALEPDVIEEARGLLARAEASKAELAPALDRRKERSRAVQGHRAEIRAALVTFRRAWGAAHALAPHEVPPLPAET